MEGSLKQVFLCIFLCILAFASAAQSPHFRHITVTTGLPSSEVYHIMQDKEGYIWFSTDLGLCRYDGYNFTTYTTREGLPDNCIFQLTEDHKGRKWLRTFNGNICYLQDNKVISVDANPAIKKWLGRGYLKSLYVDSGDTLWIGAISTSSCLKVLPGYGKDAIQQVTQRPSNYIRQVDDKGFVWGHQSDPRGVWNKQDIELWWKNNHSVYIPDTFETGQSRNSYCIRLQDGNFLFANNNEIFLIGPDGLILNRQFEKSIIDVTQTSDGRIWLGFFYGGAVCFSSSAALTGPPMKTYLSNRSVSWIMKDNEGAIWFATLDDGVYYINPEDILEYGVSEGLSTNKVNTVTMHSGKIWAGLDNGSVAMVDPATQSIKEYKPAPPGIKASSIQAIGMFDGIMCTGGTSGLYTFTATQPSFKRYTTLVRALCKSTNGDLWVGAVNSVIRRNIHAAGITIDSIDLHQRITSVHEDSKGTLWIGTINGLWMYHDHRLEQFMPGDPLLSGKVAAITTSENVLWIATIGHGVLMVKDGIVKQVNTSNGLSSDMCRSLYIDGKGNVWVATNKGINKIVPRSQPLVYSYSSRNGLGSDDVLSVTGSGDTICLATSDGIVLFSSIKLNLTPPPLYLKNVLLGDEAAAPATEYVVPYSDNTIQVDYLAISYQWPGSISYRYRMEGLDKKWNSTTGTSVRYMSVPPGEYTLMIYAINADGYPSKPVLINFRVTPPFYRTWWFYLAAFCTIPVIMLIIFRRRIRMVKQKEEEKAVFNRQISVIELKALKAQMNPHFIFNAINAIQSFIIKQDREAAQSYLSKFSKLVRNVLENSEQQFITLEKEIQTLELYLEIEKLRYGNKLDYEIIVDDDITIEEIRIPPMLIQPYVENAIRHGISPLPGGGRTTIRFTREDNVLKAIVRDNGIGFKAAQMNKTAANHTSLGMKVTSDRIRIINKVHSKASNYSVHVIDMSDSGTNGTQVEIYIPL